MTRGLLDLIHPLGQVRLAESIQKSILAPPETGEEQGPTRQAFTEVRHFDPCGRGAPLRCSSRCCTADIGNQVKKKKDGKSAQSRLGKQTYASRGP